MARYFLECAYRGTNYSGFQVQQNAETVQSQIAKAFQVLQRTHVLLTGSSRTDAGVHALQNFFHFDYDGEIHSQFIYKINAILPDDIVLRNIYLMPETAHARFDAISREYVYRIHRFKDPFAVQRSLYYPYKLNLELMQEGASFIKSQQNFFAFSKTNSQVNNFNCGIIKSEWAFNEHEISYTIKANRFLRGMVRLITATLLKVGRGKLSMHELKALFESNQKCGFSIPAHGLYLKRVEYPENYFVASTKRFTEI
jgi:tRNA pseudouridine38-40 synthase